MLCPSLFSTNNFNSNIAKIEEYIYKVPERAPLSAWENWEERCIEKNFHRRGDLELNPQG